MFFRPQKNIPHKIPVRKSDIAPMLFFIDVVKSENFSNPIIPLPLRIDKISNGQPINYILPKRNPILEIKQDMSISPIQSAYFDLTCLYQQGILNLFNYASKKYYEVTFRPLNLKSASLSWDLSLKYYSLINSYQEDMEFILKSYLFGYENFLTTGDETGALIKYCDEIIKLCNTRIQDNKISLIQNNKDINVAMYKKKLGKIYPDVIPIDRYEVQTKKRNEMAFIPLLIYDDLLECFLSNKEVLLRNEGKIIQFNEVIQLNLLMFQNGIPKFREISFIYELSLTTPIRMQ